jgi:hypothetical protein
MAMRLNEPRHDPMALGIDDDIIMILLGFNVSCYLFDFSLFDQYAARLVIPARHR